jgi:hypothetical protein
MAQNEILALRPKKSRAGKSFKPHQKLVFLAPSLAGAQLIMSGFFVSTFAFSWGQLAPDTDTRAAQCAVDHDHRGLPDFKASTAFFCGARHFGSAAQNPPLC